MKQISEFFATLALCTLLLVSGPVNLVDAAEYEEVDTFSCSDQIQAGQEEAEEEIPEAPDDTSAPKRTSCFPDGDNDGL